jgi:hypothetical protein
MIINYDPECVRKRTHWSKSGKEYKFDTPDFDREKMAADIDDHSPKLRALLNKIDQLDARDMRVDGKKYKHFIFSDLKSGAKLLASALLSKGMVLGYTAPLLKKQQQEQGVDKKKKPKTYGKIRLLGDDELHPTRRNNFYLLSSVAVYDQPIAVATKKAILQRFNARPDNVYGENVRFIIMDSGFKEGIDLFDIKYIHIFEPQTTAADQKQVIGRGTRTCGQKGLVFHPTKGWPLDVFVYNVDIPEELQSTFLGAKTAFDLYLTAQNIDIRLFRFAQELEEATVLGSVDFDLNRKIHQFSAVGPDEDDVVLGGGPKRIIVRTDLPPIVINHMAAPVQTRLNHEDMRAYVADRFGAFSWEGVKMENLCAEPTVQSKPQMGGGSSLITFTPSQDFVRHYFTPETPVKGMLLWHSVGSGKTCSAIATATSSFEPAGYTILWVTRTTLKNDIWKNMFDQVCHEVIRKEVADGTVVPDDQAKRMRLLSKAWRIRPMSYKQFSNLVSKQNRLYDSLVKINGAADPLRKTLLIIDEAHKLYGGNDLSSIERPDMDALQKALQHSYSTSGADSARLLLMTGTPITSDPLELIKLLNLCKPAAEQMPADFTTFSETYLDAEGGFSALGKARYLDDVAGYVSYLNREKDARQFAQPKLHPISVPMIQDVNEVLQLDTKLARAQLKTEVDATKEKIEQEMAKVDQELDEVDSGTFQHWMDKCEELVAGSESKTLISGCKKVVRANIREAVKEAKTHTRKIRDDVKAIRKELRETTKARRETIKQAKEALKDKPAELARYQRGVFYSLKSNCAKKIRPDTKFIEYAADHPDVARLNREMADYDQRERSVEANLQNEVEANKARVKQIKDMLKDGELNPLEKATLKLVLNDRRKTAKRETAAAKKAAMGEVGAIHHTRKAIEKDRKTEYRRLRKTLKATLRNEKAKTKAQEREAKKLRKTLKRQGELREELKNDVLKEVAHRYREKIDDDFAKVREGLLEKAKEKAEAKALKAQEKADAKALKAQEKADAKALKAQEKADAKALKAQEKADAKAEAKTRKAREKAEAKALKAQEKAAAKTKKARA